MQARQAHTTARHSRTADPLQRFLPSPPDSIRQEQGKPAEGLPSYRASRPCAPPARIHLSMAKNAARCMSPRSTLRCPMHRTPLAIAPHSFPSARTTPAFAPPYFPIWNSASLVASKARPICRKSLRAKPGITPLPPLQPVPRPQISNS